MKVDIIQLVDIQIAEEGHTQGIFDHILYVHPESVKEALMKDPRIEDVQIDIARPGDSVRILPVKDVIAPRAKRGNGSIFPGLIDPIQKVSEDATIVLENCAVVTTGPIVGFQEGIIDMSGPAAEYSPFSQLNLLVLEIRPVPGLTTHEHEEVVRLAGIAAAHHIGRLGLDATVDRTNVYELSPTPDLPNIVYVDLCMAQGLLHDTYYYGGNMQTQSPMLIDPFSLFDGALVSGNCVSPGSKTTTYHHQNNAVIRELLVEHGTRFNFRAMILSPLKTRLKDKERSAMLVAQLARFVAADGVIVSQEGFGNPTTDLMMITEQLEKSGIKTVILSNEDAGTDGFSESLPDSTPYADAIVSTGNSNARLLLPPMERTIGDIYAVEKITGGFHGSILPDGGLDVEVHGIMGSHNLQGMTHLRARSV